MKRKITTRSVTSLVLLCTLIMLPLSAIITHATHGTRICHVWLHLHVFFGVLFTVAGICHVIFNWRAIIHYLR